MSLSIPALYEKKLKHYICLSISSQKKENYRNLIVKTV